MSCQSCKKYPLEDGDSYEACQTPLGSSYYFYEQFECFNPCKLCKNYCDKCYDFGEIETSYCYHCDKEISNCQVFLCSRSNCVIQCIDCAGEEFNSGLCGNCYADACDEQTQNLIDSFS